MGTLTLQHYTMYSAKNEKRLYELSKSLLAGNAAMFPEEQVAQLRDVIRKDYFEKRNKERIEEGLPILANARNRHIQQAPFGKRKY